jgi:hypothetical protein
MIRLWAVQRIARHAHERSVTGDNPVGRARIKATTG